jgi:hypothetical protein
LERGGSSAVGRGQTDRPGHEQRHYYHHAPTVKPEAATAVIELLMMGVRTPETCSAVHKRQVINLRNCCIWLVDLFEMYDDARTCKFKNLLYVRISFSYKLVCPTEGYVTVLSDVASALLLSLLAVVCVSLLH